MNPNYSLYANPSFIEGMARIFDFSGSLNIYNISRTEEEADLKALRSDWLKIGRDLHEAINSENAFNELNEQKKSRSDSK